MFFDVSNLIQTGGLALIALIIFAESGMFVGFFFPGDTLLLSAGIFAAQGKLSLPALLIVVALAAILGDNIGYLIGRRFGRQLFTKKSLVFKAEHLRRAEEFYGRYGSRAMLFAHFLPVIRTFAPAAAGIANMDRRLFFIYDAIGDTAWAIIVTLIGYWFGTKIPNIDHYIVLAIAGVMLFTLAPTIYHIIRAILRKKSKNGPPKNSDR